jgi:iron complex transport system substrate-binding protein
MEFRFIRKLSKACLCLIMCMLFCWCSNRGKQLQPVDTYSRIISLAPNITETLFALALGDRVVGVTSFCKFPPEAKKIPSIGGYTDPNFEMIVHLKPDLVILMKEHSLVLDFLKKNHIEYLLVDNHNLSSIQESILLIGKKCGKKDKADSLVALIKNECVRAVRVEKPPRALLCVERDNRGSGMIERVYAAGCSTFYNDLLKASGMTNAVEGKIDYPQISVEGIVNINPDIIFDMTAMDFHLSPQTLKDDWRMLNMVPAVRNHMVFCLSDDHFLVPGPRVYLVLREFIRIASEYRRFSDAQH